MISLQILAAFAVLLVGVNTQNFASPCPRLFVYDRKSKEPDRWDGIVTLLSDIDLEGVWLRLMFDRPSLLLGNWFGQAEPRNENKEYLIKNRTFHLTAHMPQTVRFFIKYDPNAPAPKLTGFRLNAQTVCPEGDPESVTVGLELHTSSQLHPAEIGGSNSVIRPGGVNIVSHISSTSQNGPPVNAPQANPTDIEVNDVCGTITAVAPRPLITHAFETSEGEFPWHAAIYQTKGINLDYICGGSLVTKSHIITAGHCATKPRRKEPRDVDSLVIYLGRFYLHRLTQGIQERLVANIIPHPEFNPQKLSNDIALVKFTEPVEITDYVRPICLWQGSPDLDAVISQLGSVVGWGIDETGKLTEQLMQAKMPVVSQETCLRSVPSFYPQFTSDRTYCAGFNNGTSVCNGDSGGGMVFPKSGQNKWQLRGIVSLSIDLNKQFKCDSTHYIVFTDVAKYLTWLRRALQE